MAETQTSVAKTQKPSFMKRLKRFFTETKSELKKVTWPSKEQLIHNTTVILVFIFVITILLSVLDTAFSQLFKALTSLF